MTYFPCLIKVITMKNNYAGPESKIKFNSMYGIFVCMSFCSQISFSIHNHALLFLNEPPSPLKWA